MNTENMQLVRDHVAANAEFDMTCVTHDCGSAACIVGSAAIVSGYSDEEEVAEWLEITIGQYYSIYGGEFAGKPMSQITKEEAVNYLDRCIAAEEVLDQ